MKEKLDRLRSLGFEVQCLHFRQRARGNSFILASEARKSHKPVKTRGGLTVVSVRAPNGKTYASYSQCCAKDNFNRRRGFQISLERILQQLEKSNLLQEKLKIS